MAIGFGPARAPDAGFKGARLWLFCAAAAEG